MNLPPEINWADPAIDQAVTAGLLHRNMPAGKISARVSGSLCYLATPYTKLSTGADGFWSAENSENASLRAADYAAYLATHNITSISPIAQAHMMVRAAGGQEFLDPLDEVFWTRWCAPLLQQCRAIIVPKIPGWQESLGVWHEVRTALSSNRRVFILGAPEW